MNMYDRTHTNAVFGGSKLKNISTVVVVQLHGIILKKVWLIAKLTVTQHVLSHLIQLDCIKLKQQK